MLNSSVPHLLGMPFIVQVPAMAAGAEFDYTLPAGYRYAIYSVHLNFVTDATVATRMPCLHIGNVAWTFWSMMSGYTQAASQTHSHNWAAGSYRVRIAGDADFNAFLLYPCYLPGDFHIRTVTANIVAGDQYTASYILGSKWPEIT